VVVRYEAVYHRAEAAEGERRLLLAVLEDGIRTLLKYARATHGRARTLRREALAWIRTDSRDDVFAFESICETLGIDAARLRGRVLAEAIDPPPRHESPRPEPVHHQVPSRQSPCHEVVGH
jgi:hypothetical protein